MLRSPLPPPLRWCRRASAPLPNSLTHTHTPRSPGSCTVSSGSKGRFKKKDMSSRALPPPGCAARERWERACASGPTWRRRGRPPPPPSLPRARRLSLAALRWAGRRPEPAGPLLAAAAARWRSHLPDMTNSRGAEPPRPAENKANERPGGAAAGAGLRAARRAVADCGAAAANQRPPGDTTAPGPEGWLRANSSPPTPESLPGLPSATVPLLRGN